MACALAVPQKFHYGFRVIANSTGMTMLSTTNLANPRMRITMYVHCRSSAEKCFNPQPAPSAN
jgi:uncharacterized iron-regulated protein